MTFQKVEEWKNADPTPRIAQDRGVSGVISAQWFRAIGWKALTAELPTTPSRCDECTDVPNDAMAVVK